MKGSVQRHFHITLFPWISILNAGYGEWENIVLCLEVKHAQKLDNWQDSKWEFLVDKVELNKQLVTKKHKIEI